MTRVAGPVAAVALATALVYTLRPIAPTLSLGVLYVLPVLGTAAAWGLAPAVAVAVGSMLAFNFLFLPPVHTFTLADGRNWTALAVYVATGVIGSELASRARRRAREAERREREAALLADAAASLLQEEPLDDIRARADDVLRDSDDIARARFDTAMSSLIEVAALRRSDALKTAVLQTVSHDFRTPLATIAASVEGLRSDTLALTPADRRDLLETTAVEVARLSRLIENVLDLSRLQVGAAAPHTALWPADELVAQAIGEVRRPERVSARLDADLPVADVDAVQVQRALVNLIENALKFSAGPVTVHAHGDGERLLLEVLDDGDAVGQPGLGLGLSIARGFAEVNGGSVELDTSGIRTVARLTLPARAVPGVVRA